ncbi:hypothetical protein HJC23_005690 [Cyclotella cryptica]|uniref:Uncharacterized protein n=1 Tax=Cyclotella cryptica TaxID=29204 RepID=A0ABD3PDX5_9STRA
MLPHSEEYHRGNPSLLLLAVLVLYSLCGLETFETIGESSMLKKFHIVHLTKHKSHHHGIDLELNPPASGRVINRVQHNPRIIANRNRYL